MIGHRRILLALLPLAALCGCATVPGQAHDPRDPLERMNRGVYAFNDGLDRAIVRPAARGYKAVVPKFMQTGVSNFFANAKYPVTIVTALLQGKFRAAASDTARFTLNSTLGLGGLLDPATDAGLEVNDEDFGQTLGKWGVPPGAYVVVPFLGPYTIRDGIGSLADNVSEPRSYLEDDSTRWILWGADKFETRVRLLEADAVLDRTGDPYAFVRSAYLQRREYLVRDGNMPVEGPDAGLEDPEADDPAEKQPSQPPQPLKPQDAAGSPLR